MKANRSVLAAVSSLCLISSPLLAAERRTIDIAAGPLGFVLAELGRQSGISIGGTDPGVSLIPSPGLHGRLSPRAALGRLLAGTGYRAVAVDVDTYHIVRAPRSPLPRPIMSPPPSANLTNDIIITASKRGEPLLRFPGSVTLLQMGDQDRFGTGEARDMHSISGNSPIIQSTEQGDGRNKLFIRGVADSSFTGPTRSTAAVYLGEAQLGYNGADPNLNLYDVERVEVLEGPQGTLYGAGSIGGIVRLVPHKPDMRRYGGDVTASISSTQGGQQTYEIAGMINLPVWRDVVALRLVGYWSRDGGYVDDPSRGLFNINHDHIWGGRASLSIKPADGWTVDINYVNQMIHSPDTQYVDRGAPGMMRSSTIAQPFEGDFQLRQIVLNKSWDSGMQLVSATGQVDNSADDRFDATSRLRPDYPLAYDTHDRNKLITQETRLSRATPNGNSWLVGLSYIDDTDAIQREFGTPGAVRSITGVTNRARDMSAFSEGTLALNEIFSVSAGGRVTHTRTDSDPAFVRTGTSFIRGRALTRLSPMLAATALLSHRLALFSRYGSGFRSGGLAVAPGVGRVATFTPDTIRVIEAGIRMERVGSTGLSGSASLSNGRWSQIQADLVDRRGFPYTTNIGNGRITAFEANADWIPFAGLDLNVALFLSRSRLVDPIMTLSQQEGDDLPDTPRVAANGRISYHWAGGPNVTWSVAGSAQYAGRSSVGIGPTLDARQGNYSRFAINGGWRRKAISASLTLDNILNTHGNRFALGNPFGAAEGNQITPQRPRTLRLSVSISR